VTHRIITVAALVGLVVVLTGCNEQAPPADTGPDTVVVDVIAVAKALGRDDTLSDQMLQVNQRLAQQLQEIQQNLQEQIDAKTAEFGDAPTQEQTRQLQELTAAARQRLAQARMVAQQRQQQVSAALGAQFRDEIKPIAEKIAADMGASVAIMNTNNVLWHTTEADITGQVIDQLRAAQTQSNADAGGPTKPAAGNGNGSGSAE